MQAVVGVQAHREGGRVGAADDDGACVFEVGDDRTVFLRDEVLERDNAVVGRRAGEIDIDLDGDRHTMQRTQRMAACARGVGGLGGGAGFAFENMDHCVDRGIDLVQALQDRVDGLDGGGAAGADQGREFGRVQLPEFGHRTSPQKMEKYSRCSQSSAPLEKRSISACLSFT